MKSLESEFRRAARIISNADALVIGAGAGMGVDSGLPDFRGNGGFWKAYPALAKAQLNFTDVATPRTFDRDPALAWGFYGHRLNLYRKTVPHAGFEILNKWSQRLAHGSWIFTSNVDGQFQRAGFPANRIHECHGSIHYLQCMNQCVSGVWSANAFLPEVDPETCQISNAMPKCVACDQLARPNILMFGDWNWLCERQQQQLQRERQWFGAITNSLANVAVVEIGAGTSIPSVRHFSHRISKEYGASIIRINPSEYLVSGSKDVGIPMGAFVALSGIDAALTQMGTSNSSTEI